jgi:phospholipid-binding lipoprotein MlaA
MGHFGKAVYEFTSSRAIQLSLSFLVIGLLSTGCAQTQNSLDAANDPFEKTNRAVFAFDQNLDQHLLLPIARGYVAIVPEPARNGIHNFLLNLDSPVTFANDLLQGSIDRASQTLGRFALNTTLGIGGLFDPATDFGVPYHDEDFGQTLGVYGVGEGPYLVLPFFGPDPPRDAAGQIVDIFLDPTTYIHLREHAWYSVGRSTLDVLDVRSRNLDTLKGIERESLDYYASVRSLYRQRRQNDIRNGAPDVSNLPDL